MGYSITKSISYMTEEPEIRSKSEVWRIMARPVKVRRISALPEVYKQEGPAVTLTLDEFECIRLIDHCGLSQAECGIQMEVARTTIALIYERARRKIAESIVYGRPLEISGGSYRLSGSEEQGSK